MSKILGIDYGLKRVGLAISDSLQMIASGLTTVPTAKIFLFLSELIQKENISCFVVGDPRNLDGNPTDSTLAVDRFIKRLNKEFPNINIHRVDERFTSKIAKRSIIDSGIPKFKRRNKGLVDQVSATIILQDYLA